MPIVCINRPNRSKRRTFNAKTVGQAACYALKAGEDRGAIREKVNECIGEDPECEEIKQLIRDILAAIATALIILSIPESAIFAGLLTVLRAASTLIPRLRPVVGLLENLPKAAQILLEIEKKGSSVIP